MQVAVGDLGSIQATEDDAVWSEHDMQVSVTLKDVVSNCFVAVGRGGVVLTWLLPLFTDGFESGDTSGWSLATQ